MSELTDTLHEAIDKAKEIERDFYTRQIKGLILVMQQNNGTLFVSKKYIIEKLDMILNGGIGFHSLIEEKLDE